MADVGLELVAQLAHVHRHGAAVAPRAPHALEDLLAAEHVARMGHEQRKQLELARRQPNRAPVDEDLVGGEVDLEAPVVAPARGASVGAAAQHPFTRATTSAGVADLTM